MSERRLIGLLRNLPPESATVRALTGADPGTQWSQTDYLLAAALDAINRLCWISGVLATERRFEENPMGDEPPEPVYRPVAPQEPVIPETPLADMATWIGQIGHIDGG